MLVCWRPRSYRCWWRSRVLSAEGVWAPAAPAASVPAARPTPQGCCWRRPGDSSGGGGRAAGSMRSAAMGRCHRLSAGAPCGTVRVTHRWEWRGRAGVPWPPDPLRDRSGPGRDPAGTAALRRWARRGSRWPDGQTPKGAGGKRGTIGADAMNEPPARSGGSGPCREICAWQIFLGLFWFCLFVSQQSCSVFL